MELSVWLPFFVASWAISVSPGPGAVAAMSAGAQHGFARGYLATIGLVLGLWTQLLAVGVGLGALIATSSAAFSIVKWLGVAYLVAIGVRQWRAPAGPLVAHDGAAAAPALRTLVLRGWTVNAVNPKGTVFLLAVVPQFLDMAAPLAPQYLVIGATLAFTDAVVMGLYTALAARLLRRLREPRAARHVQRTFGTLFVAAGVLLATFRRGA